MHFSFIPSKAINTSGKSENIEKVKLCLYVHIEIAIKRFSFKISIIIY